LFQQNFIWGAWELRARWSLTIQKQFLLPWDICIEWHLLLI
jgi:hypothetical protein